MNFSPADGLSVSAKNMKAFTVALALSVLMLRGEEKTPDPGGVKKVEVAIEKSWFPNVDGESTRGQFIDLPAAYMGRLYIRYCPIADSGVELERVSSEGKILWRKHVMPLGVSHSIYSQQVDVRIRNANIHVTSFGADQIYEVRDLATGAQVSRKITEIKKH